MGLTTEPKASADLYILVQQLVGVISDLSSDPKALQNAIKATYGLKDDELARADKARADIDANRAVLASIRDETKANQNFAAELDARAKELNDEADALNKKSIEQGRYSRSLDDRETAVTAREKTSDKRESEAATQKQWLADREAELNQRQKDLDVQAQDLKERLDKLQAIATGG